jgi:hypothetical protein
MGVIASVCNQSTFEAFAFEIRLRVIAPAVASLTADFPATLFLPAGFSRTFNLVTSFSGNATEMDVLVENEAPISISGISTTGVPEIIRGHGTTTLAVTFSAPSEATSTPPLPVTFHWRVPSPDGDVTGTLGLNIVTDPASRRETDPRKPVSSQGGRRFTELPLGNTG